MVVEVARRLFTVDDYYRMAEAGILREDDRVELIQGEIIQMPPIGSPHASVVARLNALVSRQLAPRQVHISVQSPVRLDEYSEPQPDFALCRFRSDFYSSAHPGPADVLLLVEVSDSTITYDRTIKVPLYARAGIAEVWIIDIARGEVEVHRDPVEGSYQATTLASRGDLVSPALIPQLTLSVADILG